jgi:hypothetical protein
MHPDHEPDESLVHRLADLTPEMFADPEGGQALRESSFASTRGVLRRRRVVRRAAHGTLLALVFAGGFLTARLGPGASDTPVATGELAGSVAAGPLPWQGDLEMEAAGAPAKDPRDLERLARTGSRAIRSERLRRAGDLYLRERGDVVSATRCYRELLEILPRSNRGEIVAEDSWLLAALKLDTRERS